MRFLLLVIPLGTLAYAFVWLSRAESCLTEERRRFKWKWLVFGRMMIFRRKHFVGLGWEYYKRSWMLFILGYILFFVVVIILVNSY
jgi:hypothetical protein